MATIDEFVQRVTALKESNAAVIKELAQAVQNFPNNINVVVDVMFRKIKDAKGKEKLAAWYMLDAAIKATPFGRSKLATRVRVDLLSLTTEHIPWGESDAKKYERMVNSWSKLYGKEEVDAILAVRDRQGGAAPAGEMPAPPGQMPEAPRVAPHDVGAPHTPFEPRRMTRTELTPWEGDEEGAPDRNMVAPPMPVEINHVHAAPRPQPNAPMGYVKAPTAEKLQAYLQAKRANLKNIMEKNKRKRETEEAEMADEEIDPNETEGQKKKRIRRVLKKRMTQLVTNARFVAEEIDDTKWPSMPDAFPRDPETGVQIGNYVDGVVFIRNAIRDAGGALELQRLNNKIPNVQSLANRIKSVREFVDIHTPTTFLVTKEEGEIIVRLSADTPPRAGEIPSWVSTPCPDCGKIVPGHNLPKHRSSKMCILKQMNLGKEGKGKSTIAQISNIAHRTNQISRETGGDPEMDDDDILHFGTLIHKAALNPRTRHARKQDWTHVIRAIQVIHAFWIDEKGVEASSDVQLTTDDRAMVAFLETVGGNMHRLPISYLDFGEFQAMAGPFLPQGGYYPPANNPPRFGATNIIPKTCSCPGFVFCDSEAGSDNPRDTDKDSDDEQDKNGVTAAPLSFAQALATVGTEEQGDKQKLLKLAAQNIEWKRSNPITGNMDPQQLQIGYGNQPPGFNAANQQRAATQQAPPVPQIYPPGAPPPPAAPFVPQGQGEYM